jgi:hypothetical protein
MNPLRSLKIDVIGLFSSSLEICGARRVGVVANENTE